MTVVARPVTFANRDIDVAGVLRRPDSPSPDGQHAALVIVTPGSSVTEQIGATYGEAMAERGFVTLTFDPSYQGQSSGEPRDLEDPAARVEDVRCAVDHLNTVPDVAQDRIGVLGICAGGGYTVSAALTEHRIRAVGTVVAVNIGRAHREASAAGGGVVAALEAVGEQRASEALGGPARREHWIRDDAAQAEAAGIDDPDVLDAVRYYRTPRGFDEHSTNRRYFPSDALLLGFDAFHLVEELLTQPLKVIVGGRRGSTGSFEDGHLLHDRAPNAVGDVVVVEGAGHYEVYDTPRYVSQAVDVLDGSSREQLAETG